MAAGARSYNDLITGAVALRPVFLALSLIFNPRLPMSASTVFCSSGRLVGLVSIGAGVLLLGGCGHLDAVSSRLPSVESLVTPYRMDVIQGNFVSREQAAALAVGMPKSQVRDLLGTPLVTSVFHADRWDYVFTFQRQGQAPQQRRLTVFFKGDLLERTEADALPTEAEFIASLDVKTRERRAPVLQASEADLKAFAAQNAPAAPAAEPFARPNTQYPPLEPPVAPGDR